MAKHFADSDSLNSKIKEQERVIESLHYSLNRLRSENNALRARLNQVESSEYQTQLKALSNKIKLLQGGKTTDQTSPQEPLSIENMITALDELLTASHSDKYERSYNRSPSPAFTFGHEELPDLAKFTLRLDSADTSDVNGSDTISTSNSSKANACKCKEFLSPVTKSSKKKSTGFLSMFKRMSDSAGSSK